MKFVEICACFHGFHRLVDIDVKQSGLAVRKHTVHDIKRVILQLIGTFEAPTHHYVFCIKSDDSGIAWTRNGLLGLELGSGKLFAGLPAAEVSVDDCDNGVWIEVACKHDSHIIGHIITVEIVLDVDD